MFGAAGAIVKRKIEVSTGTLSGALDRFERVWRRAEAGKTQRPEIRLTFETLPALLNALTPARWELLAAAKRAGPVSINQLARVFGRNYKNVHTDVTRLIELGLIERKSDRRVAVIWDVIAAEMRLAAS